MQRSLVVVDTDGMRLSETLKAITSQFPTSVLSVQATTDFSEIKQMVMKRELDVLLVDIRSRSEGGNPIKATCEAVRGSFGVQIIYAGVDESTLVQASCSGCACLLPTSYGPELLYMTVAGALSVIDATYEQPLLFHTRDFDRLVSPQRMSYVESNRRKLRIHLDDGVLEVYGKISELLQKLPCRFVQCHKSFLVNLGYVEQLRRDCVVLTTGECVPVSQKRRKRTREEFALFVGRSV